MPVHYFSTTLLIIVTDINPVNWFEIKELCLFFFGGGGSKIIFLLFVAWVNTQSVKVKDRIYLTSLYFNVLIN